MRRADDMPDRVPHAPPMPRSRVACNVVRRAVGRRRDAARCPTDVHGTRWPRRSAHDGAQRPKAKGTIGSSARMPRSSAPSASETCAAASAQLRRTTVTVQGRDTTYTTRPECNVALPRRVASIGRPLLPLRRPPPLRPDPNAVAGCPRSGPRRSGGSNACHSDRYEWLLAR